MNDPNKVINVNLSSLLSLKAELLRKQAEVSKAKVAQSSSSAKTQEYVSISSQRPQEQNGDEDDDFSKAHKSKHKKKSTQDKEKDDHPKVIELEDSLLLEKSQKVLAAKAKFYERMSKSGGKLNSDDNCLVMFNKKKQEQQQSGYISPRQVSDVSDSSSDDDLSDHPEDSDDEWVEYTDCLGRTRKCLKGDLKENKRRDKELAASMPERLDQTKANWMIDTVGSRDQGNESEDDVIGPLPPASVFGDGLSTMSKHEEQKASWDRKEQENLEKTDVHYQDVFFDEARQHGVGYYAFSTDEEERKKQQKQLEKQRQQTLEEQQRREAMRAQRESIIAERVLAAKNRQRARLGLPPLEKTEEQNAEKQEEHAETKEERKARKKAEKLEKKRLKEEQEREKERQNHIRPWDEDKDGVKSKNPEASEEEWQYKPEREPMSQEQWNEMKRNERNDEFAPPPAETPLKRTNFRSSAAQDMSYNNMPPPAAYAEHVLSFSSFQSSRKNQRSFKRRNYEEPLPAEEEPLQPNRGACIPPPSNLEDFPLPSHSKRSKSAFEVEKSIEAGLRFIRDSCDKQMPATKQSWTAKADY